MSRPARFPLDDEFIAFDTEAAQAAPFIPLSVEEEQKEWEPLYASGDDETDNALPQAEPFADAFPASDGGFPESASMPGLPDLPDPGLPEFEPGPAGLDAPEPSFPDMSGSGEDLAAFAAFAAGEDEAPASLVLPDMLPGDGAVLPDTGDDAQAPAQPLPGAPDPSPDMTLEEEDAVGSENDGYGFVSAAAGSPEQAAARDAQARLLADQLAAGLERISVELAEQVSASVGRILEPIVSQAVHKRMTGRFMEAVTEALAMRPDSPCRLEAPHALVPGLRSHLEEKGFKIDIVEGPDDGLTLRLDRQVLAARFSGLGDLAGGKPDE